MSKRVPLAISLSAIFLFGVLAVFVSTLFHAAGDGAVGRGVHLLEGVGDALMIAAILGFVVDGYTKMKLATEVGERIADKIHGYYLPDGLREAINKVNDFTFVWGEVVWDIRMTPVPGAEGCLHWRATLSYDIVNITPVEQVFVHTARLRSAAGFPQNSDAPKIVEVSYFLDDIEQYRYREGEPEFAKGYSALPTEMLWKNGDEIRIPGRNKHDPKPPHRYRFYNTVERNVYENDVRSLFFIYPVINGVKLRVDKPDGFDVFTSLESDGVKRSPPPGEERGLEWHTKDVFLNNQRVSVRHRRAFPNEYSAPTTAATHTNGKTSSVYSPMARLTTALRKTLAARSRALMHAASSPSKP